MKYFAMIGMLALSLAWTNPASAAPSCPTVDKLRTMTPEEEESAVVNKVSIGNRVVTWNEEPLGQDELTEFVVFARTQDPVPMILVSATDCKMADSFIPMLLSKGFVVVREGGSNDAAGSPALAENSSQVPQSPSASSAPAAGAVECLTYETGALAGTIVNKCAFAVNFGFCATHTDEMPATKLVARSLACGRSGKVIQGADHVSATGTQGIVLVELPARLQIFACKSPGIAVNAREVTTDQYTFDCH